MAKGARGGGEGHDVGYRRARAALVLAGVALSGCTLDPAAPLIPLPERPATVLPSQALELQANGFPNILADPAPVAGLPRTEAEVAGDVGAMASEAAAAEAETANLPPPSIAGAMRARANSHVAEARRAIEATGRPQTGVREVPANLATPQPSRARVPEPELSPARPLDPDVPAPRAVGVPPFTGTPE